MSERPPPWSEVVSGIFAILTAITTYLGTQPLNTLFAVLLGATVTYSVQKRLQRETEKRSKNAEYVEKYYGPLLVEIQKIQEVILNNVSGYYDFTSLKDFKTRPQFYTMGKRLKADFLAFADEIAKFAEKINYYRGITIGLICSIGNPNLVRGNSVSDTLYSPVCLRYYRESNHFIATLDECILRGKNPIDIVKDNVTDFKEDGLEVDFYLDVDDGQGNIGKGHDSKNFTERKELLSEIISKVNVELDMNEGYRNFQSELFDLRQKAELLSVRLAKYVEEYVSIVNV